MYQTEDFLLTSIFSFSRNGFFAVWKTAIIIKATSDLSSANTCGFVKVKNVPFDKDFNPFPNNKF